MKAQPKRQVFSVNVTDVELANHITLRAAAHPNGITGYFRELVILDHVKWKDMEKLRTQTLAKLTDNERASLGFP